MRLLGLTFVLITITVAPSLGQDAGFVPGAFSDLTITLAGSGSDGSSNVTTAIQCFEGARNADPGATKVYAFSPYFEFVTYAAGNKAYQLIDLGTNKKTVKMRLALYDDTLKNASALWISQQTNASVTISNVLPLPIFSLTITENNTGVTTTLPQGSVNASTSLVVSPVMDIYFRNLSDLTAQQLEAAIDSKQTDFSFTYYYKTSSTTLGAYTITYDDIHKNSVFNQLTGNGGVGLVTRAGITQISGAVAQSMTITSYCEDPSCAPTITQDLINLFTNKMQFNKTISFADSSQLKQMDQLTIDPRGPDFEAATLNTIHDALKTSHDYNDVNKNIVSAHLGGGYGPFKADGGFSSDNEVNQAIKDTFDHDWTGNDWSTVPKTINVYQINGSDFQGSATIRQVTVKPTFSMRSFQNDPVQVYFSVDALSKAVKNTDADRFVLVPIGTILAYSGPLDPSHSLPNSWLTCDGSALSKAQYPNLYAALGTTYGDGHDSTGAKTGDFNLPDYRGYFLRGVDDGTRDKGPRDGSGVGSGEPFSTALPKEHQFVTDAQGQHSHSINLEINAGRQDGGLRNSVASPNIGGPVRNTDAAGNHQHTIVAGGDNETRPVNKSVFWVIRAR